MIISVGASHPVQFTLPMDEATNRCKRIRAHGYSTQSPTVIQKTSLSHKNGHKTRKQKTEIWHMSPELFVDSNLETALKIHVLHAGRFGRITLRALRSLHNPPSTSFQPLHLEQILEKVR